MRLADLIRRCKADGVSAVELHPDGSIAKLTFAEAKPVVTVRAKPVLTKQEELKAEQDARNPVRDRCDVAMELLGHG